MEPALKLAVTIRGERRRFWMKTRLWTLEESGVVMDEVEDGSGSRTDDREASGSKADGSGETEETPATSSPEPGRADQTPTRRGKRRQAVGSAGDNLTDL